MASVIMYNTRAGLQPSMKELPYDISTKDVENYLQQKLNVVVGDMRKKGEYRGDDINVKLITMEVGNDFVPFAIILPPSILKERQKTRNNELGIFAPKQFDITRAIYNPIGQFLKAFAYNKEDSRAFISQEWRRRSGVSGQKAGMLKKYSNPVIDNYNNGKMETITMFIDPVRVFYDMLKMDDYPTAYKVSIRKWNRIKNGEYNYKVYRVLDTAKKNKQSDDVYSAVYRKMNHSK